MSAAFKDPMGLFTNRYAQGLWAKDVLPWVKVVDNFVPNPDEIRQSALITGFGTWHPTNTIMGYKNYDGVNINGMHAPLVRGLVKAMGCAIYPMSMIFRVTGAGSDPSRVHSDRMFGDFSCIVYLSKEQGESGTAFYRHIDTDSCEHPEVTPELIADPKFERLKREMDEGTEESWDRVHYVEGKYNRAIIFKAPLYHARIPKLGTGTTPEDSRMIWVTHFNLESSFV
jgi:hypothetical protein